MSKTNTKRKLKNNNDNHEKNLNKIKVPKFSQDYDDMETKDNSITVKNISIYFRNQMDTLSDLILKADAVVGCVAWLTSEKILSSLQKLKYGCSIVVNKEDFLRPDGVNSNHKVLNMYEQLEPFTWNNSFSTVHTNNNFLFRLCTDKSNPNSENRDYNENNEPIRCCGNHNNSSNLTCSRMHNKFLVFGKISYESALAPESNFKPYAVWTGSLNLSYNSENSLENGVYIKDPKVAQAYVNEWAQILAISEPLDWTNEWCAPEYRMGS